MSTGLHARDAAEVVTRLAQRGLTEEEATLGARALAYRRKPEYIIWQCRFCGQELFREKVDPDGPETPVTPEITATLVDLLDGKFARHLRASHRGRYLRWLLTGRPSPNWFNA